MIPVLLGGLMKRQPNPLKAKNCLPYFLPAVKNLKNRSTNERVCRP